MASDALFDAVPFYAGLTLDEIGGRGVRWPERDAAAALRGAELGARRRSRSPPRRGRARTARCASAPSARSGRPRRSTSRPRCSFLRAAPARRALARRRRAPRHRATATTSRCARTARACARRRLRAAVPAGSVFVAEGMHEQPANLITEPRSRSPRRAGEREPPRRALVSPPARAWPRCRRRRRRPASTAGSRGRRMTVFAEVGYYEAWWIQILKALVIFAVALQHRAGRAARRAQAARPLPAPLRAQPRRPVRRCCSRSPTSSSSRPRSSCGPRRRSASCSRSRPASRSLTAVAAHRDHPVRRHRRHLRHRGRALRDRRRASASSTRSRSARSPSTG